jgi:hypothetical protein
MITERVTRNVFFVISEGFNYAAVALSWRVPEPPHNITQSGKGVRDSERRVTTDATQLTHCPQLLCPTPKEEKATTLATQQLPPFISPSLLSISSRRVIARPILVLCSASALPALAQFALTSGLQQRWPSRLRPCCAHRPPTGPPRSGRRSACRGRCGCRRRRAGGSPRRPGSPCASRPSRPTSAATAGESRR